MIKFLEQMRCNLRARYYIAMGKYNPTIKYLTKFFMNDYLAPNRKRKTDYDKLMTMLGEKIFYKNKINLTDTKVDFIKTKVLIINTEIYDTGGHTEIALRFVDAFKKSFDIHFLLAGCNEKSENIAPKKSKIIKEKVKEFVELPFQMTYEEKVIEIHNYIIKNQFTTIIVNIHMYDVVSAIVLGLIKKHTNINIVFWNHADHYFSLATSFADNLITRLEDGKPLLKYLKDKKNVTDFLFLEKSNEQSIYSTSEIEAEKTKLQIKSGSFITLTGAPDYKIFTDEKQPYLQLIKKLLDANDNMIHLIIGASYEKNKIIIDKIIGNELIKKRRLIFLEPTPNFDFYICLSDLYIDSFPQGSALTLLDCMRNSKPMVVKINEKEPVRSFQMYLNTDYNYSCKTTGEMFNKICELIYNKDQYKQAAKAVNKHYLKTYSIDKVKEKYLELIK